VFNFWNIFEALDANQITQLLSGAVPVVGAFVCLIMCGGMIWMMRRGMMSHGEGEKLSSEQNDRREPPSAQG